MLSEPFVLVFEVGDRSGSDVQVMFQGVPVYRVPDSADDTSTLLRAIYDGCQCVFLPR